MDNRDVHREVARLKKENEDCLKIIGELTIIIDRLKKNNKSISSKKFRILVGREIRIRYPDIPLATIAKTLGMAKSTLGYHLKLPYKDEILAKRIREVHETNPYYGHRRIALDLCIHKKRIRRVMKLAHIQAFTKKRKIWIKEEDRKFSPLPIPNLTKERIAIRPHEIWRTDFTHIEHKEEILYLSTIIDEFSKDIIAYKMSFRHKKELILETLDEAIKIQISKNLPLPFILHSDQ